MIYKNTIKDMLEDKVNEIFMEFQKELSIKSGDIEPFYAIKMDESLNYVASLIHESLLSQFKREHPVESQLQNVLNTIHCDAHNAIESNDFTNLKDVSIEYDGIKAMLPLHDSCELTNSVELSLMALIESAKQNPPVNDFAIFRTKLSSLHDALSLDTNKALDTEDFSKIKDFTIEYNGIKVNIPVDCAEFNNCIRDTLTDLLTIIKNDYID